jgi:hypothetical protein
MEDMNVKPVVSEELLAASGAKLPVDDPNHPLQAGAPEGFTKTTAGGLAAKGPNDLSQLSRKAAVSTKG